MTTPSLTIEQLIERMADLHQASLELVQDISLDSLLQRIATLAAKQSGARYCAVGVLGEDGSLAHFIPVGMSEDEIARIPHPPVGLGLIGALAKSEETIRLPRMGADPRSVGFPKGHPPMTSFLGVPIRQAGRHLGQIYLTDKIGAAEFSTDDQQVIEMLASYAAAAIANARLYSQLLKREEALTRRNEIMALLNDLAPILVTSGNIQEIIDRGLTEVMEYLGMETAEVYLRLEDGKTLSRTYHFGEGPHLWRENQYSVGEGVIGGTVDNLQPVLITLPEQTSPHLNDAVLDGRFYQIATFPLNGRLGVLGALSVATRDPLPLDELEIQFLNAISSWIGMAIENVRLNLQQRRLAVLEERERIGMDLHDGVIQSIYAVGLTLEHSRLLLNEDPHAARQRIDQAVNDLNSTIRDIRAYILDLRPRQMHDDSLSQGLQRLVAEFRANSRVEVDLQLPTDAQVKLPEDQSVALFHICQEALANVGKHARANHVDVILWATADRALLEIRDDGRGFDMDNVRLTLGHGLTNMQTRARNVGGDVELSSEPGEGTTVLAWMPVAT